MTGMRAALRLHTIRDMLMLGFTALVACLIVAGSAGWMAVRAGAHDISNELRGVLATSQQTSDYAGVVTREIEAGSAYLANHDSVSLREFKRLGAEAHQLQRRFAKRHATAAEVSSIAAVDARLSDAENAYALAHRLSDLGRAREAQAQATSARAIVSSLLDDLSRFQAAKTNEVLDTTTHLDTLARWRATAVLGAAAIAALIAIVIALRTTRAIERPLGVLTAHARRLSEGDLTVRTRDEGMPGEFETLASAMNHAGESLSRVVEVATRTADDVTHSASDLATASQQISDTATQVSEAVTQVSSGAEAQVEQLHAVTTSLASIRDGANGVAAGAEEVQALAESIHAGAASKRAELERTLTILVDVRSIVRQAAEEVRALNATVGDINKFVVSVGRIADQTNLLSLNAAIEAARAGAAGRGFGVVADEIRKLADQSRAAADDVVQLTSSVTARVAKTYATIERGETQVGELERVSHDIDEALALIAAAADRTRCAADTVARTADDNVKVVQCATAGLAAVAHTAESHAATAMQVSASTEEQSAACEQMSAASALLLRGSTHLRTLVGELKTA